MAVTDPRIRRFLLPKLDSEPGRGSIFQVVLPAAEPDVAPTPTTVHRSAAATRRSRILVIDDEPYVGHAIRRTLERAHLVTVVYSAIEGLAALGGRRFDLILCDVMLPEVSGIDLYRRLAAERPAQAERVIFITGGAFTARAREYIEQVSNPCIDKPFEPAALLAMVEDYLTRWGPAE